MMACGIWLEMIGEPLSVKPSGIRLKRIGEPLSPESESVFLLTQGLEDVSRVGVEILLTTAAAKRVVAPFVEAHARIGLYLENAATNRAGELGSHFRTLRE